MKNLVAVLIGINVLLVTAWLGLSVEQQVHYIRGRFASASYGTVTLAGNSSLPCSGYSHIERRGNTTVSTCSKEPPELQGSTEYVAPPADHPPLHIICGEYGYDVWYAPHQYFENRGVGAYSNANRRLIVLDRQADALKVRENVVHELMHLALANGGGKMQFAIGQPGLVDSEKVEEEGFIHAIAPQLRDCLVDNPELLKWLSKAGG